MKPDRLLKHLREILPADAILSDQEDLNPYESDGLTAFRQLPLLVVLPETEAQVQQILRLCHAEMVPVVARGAGTGLSGGALPLANGVLLSLAKFSRILHIDPLARTARLQPGLRNLAISEAAAEMRDSGEKLEVRVRAARKPMTDVAQLLDDPIALPRGGSTTLGALVHTETQSGLGIIKHHNLRRAITVEADLDKEVIDTLAANQQVQAEWAKVRHNYPNSDLDFSGELDDIEESLDAMKGLFLFGLGLIYLILAAQFRSYWQPLMILVTVPMAFTGVVAGLLLTQNPLSLYTLYGVIALTGIAVNSAIVLIDAANTRLKSGMSVLHASIYAARRRLIPILITSTTTIAGLFSLALGLGGKSLIWGPVASSIVWGLGIATVLTLFVMPLIYRLAMGRGART